MNPTKSYPGKRLRALTASMVLSAAAIPALAGQGPVVVQVPATMETDLANSKIGVECRLGRLLGSHVSQAMSSAHFDVTEAATVDAVPGGSRGLRLSIVSAFGLGGGGWSGGKTATLRAELVEGDKVIAARTFERGSHGGFWGGFKGTCGIFERIGQAFGRDVVRFVQRPLSEPSKNDVADESATSASDNK